MRIGTIFTIAFLFLLGCFVYFAIGQGERTNADCEKNGGAMMKTGRGYECLKVERVPLS